MYIAHDTPTNALSGLRYGKRILNLRVRLSNILGRGVFRPSRNRGELGLIRILYLGGI